MARRGGAETEWRRNGTQLSSSVEEECWLENQLAGAAQRRLTLHRRTDNMSGAGHGPYHGQSNTRNPVYSTSLVQETRTQGRPQSRLGKTSLLVVLQVPGLSLLAGGHQLLTTYKEKISSSVHSSQELSRAQQRQWVPWHSPAAAYLQRKDQFQCP